MTVAGLVHKYGSAGMAAGAIALEIEKLTAEEFMWLPEEFRALVLFKQQAAILKLSAAAAGTSVAKLQDLWRGMDEADRG